MTDATIDDSLSNADKQSTADEDIDRSATEWAEANPSDTFENMYYFARYGAEYTSSLIQDRNIRTAESGDIGKIIYRGNLDAADDPVEVASAALKDYSMFQEISVCRPGCSPESIIRIGSRSHDPVDEGAPLNNLISIGPAEKPILKYQQSTQGISIEFDMTSAEKPQIFTSPNNNLALIVTPYFYEEDILQKNGSSTHQRVNLVVILNRKNGYAELSLINLEEWANSQDYEAIQPSLEQFKESFVTKVDN